MKVHSTIMFPLKREITAQEVLTRLGNLLVELGEHSHGGRPLPEDIDVLDALKELSQRGWPLHDRLGNLVEDELGNHSQGGGILAEPFDHQLRWLKIDLESVNLKIVEDLIVDARRIVYDAEQFFGSSNILNCTDQKKREVVIDMIRRYCRMVANYLPPDSCVLGLLYFLIDNLYSLTDPIDDDVSSIFGHHLIDWIQGDQGSSTIASGGQVVGAAEGEDCFVGLDEQTLWGSPSDSLGPYEGRSIYWENPCKEMNNHLNKETCEELVRRCGGLPLAIVQLGELMQTEEWCSREALAAPEIIFNSVPMKGRVLEVLATSYDELPHELRSCFLYLRNLPVDAEIEVNKLHQLWVAESLIPSHSLLKGVSTLHLACYYLHVLASRSMVQLQVDETTGLFKYCRVHTLLRDVCFLKGNEENLQVMDLRLRKTVVVEDKEVITTMPSSSPIRRINKLAVYLVREEPKGGVFIRGGPSGVETQPGKANGKIPTMESNTDDDTYVPDDEMDCIWQFGLAQSALLK
ncbi:hypothetical protein LguiA_002307 [Lonicera macranthoides]